MTQRAFSDFIGFARASVAWRFNSSGVLVQEAANVQRDDYDPVSGLWNGFLIEEARTNYVGNNSGVGAVVGQPWWGGANNGLTRTVTAVGSEDGIAYVDLRLVGTTNSTYFDVLYLGSPNYVPLANGGAVALSAYMKLVGGSFANVASLSWSLGLYDSSQVFLTNQNAAAMVLPDGTALKAQRRSNVMTVNNASLAYVQPKMIFSCASGVAIDLTLRIGLPQCEIGAFVTSPIFTTGVGPVTRAADVPAVGSLPPWFNPSEGTLYAEFVSLSTTAAIGMSLHDGTSQQAINIGRGGSGLPSLFVTTAGTTNVSLSQGATISASLPSVRRLAAVYKAGDYALSVDGGAPATSSYAGALPTVNALAIGRNYTGSLALNGWIRAVKYAPRRMTNAELQSMTTLPNANGPTLAFDFKAQTYNLEHI